MAGRVGHAEEQVGEGRAAGLAEQEAIQDGVDVVVPAFQRDHAPVGQDDDGTRADRGDGPDDIDLGGGQVEGLPVEPLGLLPLAEPGEDDRDLGVPGGGHRLLAQRRGVATAVDGEPGREADVAAGPGGQRADSVQRGVNPGGVDVRAAAALVARCPGELTDHGDRAATGQRQGAAVVLQQHGALGGHLRAPGRDGRLRRTRRRGRPGG